MLDQASSSALIEKLQWRYATKKFDAAKIVSAEKVESILEAARLAPTSSGLQPFQVIVVTNKDIRAKLQAASYGQAQVTEASHLLVFAAWDNYTDARIDDVVTRTAADRGAPIEAVAEYYNNLKGMYLPRPADVNYEHAARQAYIAFGLALAQAAFEGVDATPMEGFDPAQVDEILGLKAHGLRSVTLLPIGYRAAEGDWLKDLPKVRKSRADLIVEVK
ncbi:NAD(P)H-dependent oxidoreductase [Rhodobacter sp. KR11]|jgi:nitroreductase/dihydropteridine reductase|uniref:NAD(P)H-dependent oxidoreductase n=1 Tax=Rhodobacter sp. KR11 TaxID=2974588 RepID=UPI002221F827|nr:NAD(P)H-dependent oxidoreductase [Rhodobacter sp. KR11]MCW1918432.1 NAD(P)H-dependent oxidoreductase [Rhodobacter sp. KR11]